MNEITPILHTGLAGRFAPANGLAASFAAGIPYARATLGVGEDVRVFYRRITFSIPSGQDDFTAQVSLEDALATTGLVLTRATVDKLDGGDLDNDATALVSDLQVIGFCARAEVTRCAAISGTGKIELMVAESGPNTGTRARLLSAPYGAVLATTDAPWIGHIAAGCTGGSGLASAGGAFFGPMDVEAGAYLAVTGDGLPGPCDGTVDLCIVALANV